MKKNKHLLFLVLILLMVCSVLTGCKKMFEDDGNLVDANYRYVITYLGEGGTYGKVTEQHLYLQESTFDRFGSSGIKLIEPGKEDFQKPTKDKYIYDFFFYKDNEGNQHTWDFESDKLKKDMLVPESAIKEGGRDNVFVFQLYPHWTKRVYYRFSFSLFNTDMEYAGAIPIDDVVDTVAQDLQDDYNGPSLVNSGYTMIKESYQGEEKSAAALRPIFYLNPECTGREVQFPLPEDLQPVPVEEVEGSEEIKLYTKWLRGNYTTITNKNEFNGNFNLGLNYFIWKDIDLEGITLNGVGTEYSGTIIGNNYSLNNFTVKPVTSAQSFGLFGTLESSAQIKNLAFKNMTVFVDIETLTRSAKSGIMAGEVKPGAIVKNVRFEDCRGFIVYRQPDSRTVSYGSDIEQKFLVYDRVPAGAFTNVTFSGLQMADYSVTLERGDGRTNAVLPFEYNYLNRRAEFGKGGTGTVTQQPADESTGRPAGKYIGIKLWLNVNDGAEIEFGGTSYSDQLKYDAEQEKYYVYLFQSEEIKTQIFTVQLNEYLPTEEYYLMNRTNRAELVGSGSPSFAVEYNDATQTLTYGRAGQILRGNSVHVAVCVYVTDPGNAFVTVDGVEKSLTEWNAQLIGNYYRFEYDQAVSDTEREKEILVRMGNDYTLTYKVVIHSGVIFR